MDEHGKSRRRLGLVVMAAASLAAPIMLRETATAAGNDQKPDTGTTVPPVTNNEIILHPKTPNKSGMIFGKDGKPHNNQMIFGKDGKPLNNQMIFGKDGKPLSNQMIYGNDHAPNNNTIILGQDAGKTGSPPGPPVQPVTPPEPSDDK